MITVPQRLRLDSEQWKILANQLACDLRVACPGIIQSFDAAKQTVTVQLALRENILLSQIEGGRVAAVPTPTQIPLLVDVPIVIPRAGQFALTLPVAAGDECLIVFGDMCIDAWYQSSGVQNQMTKRRHDLSDGFALLGCWSQPRVLADYVTDAAELRSEDGSVKVRLEAATVTITAPTVNVTGSEEVNVSGNGHTTIDGKDFLTHRHTGVQGGSANSGGVA